MTDVRIFGEKLYIEAEPGTGKGIQFIVKGWTISAMAGVGNTCFQDPSRFGNATLTPYTVRTDCEVSIWKEPDVEPIKLDKYSITRGFVDWDVVIRLVNWFQKTKVKLTEKKIRDKFRRLERKNIVENKRS